MEQARNFSVGELHIDYAGRNVIISGRRVRLTDIEYSLLVELSTRAGKVITYVRLLERVWNVKPTRDRLVRPRDQRAVAASPRGHVIRASIRASAGREGLASGARDRGPRPGSSHVCYPISDCESSPCDRNRRFFSKSGRSLMRTLAALNRERRDHAASRSLV